MKIKRYVRSNLFYIVSCLLLMSVVVSAVAISTVSKKNKTIQKMNQQITSSQAEIEQIKDELKKANEEKSKLSQNLEQANKDKKRLENENKNYKKEIEKLSAKKQAELEKLTALQNSPQSVYPTPSKTCYLTFDDGPSDNTLKILKILKKYNAKATFFVIGRAKLNYLPKIAKEGHAIGLHSNTHDYSYIYKNTANYFKDLEAISKKVQKQTGVRSMVIRFPGGSDNTVSKKYCKGVMTKLTNQVKIKGYAYFDWNVDSGDASGNNVPYKRIVNNVLNQAKNKNSICVLMHDTAAKGTTVTALPYILDGLKKQGYKFEVLTDKTYGYHHRVNN